MKITTKKTKLERSMRTTLLTARELCISVKIFASKIIDAKLRRQFFVSALNRICVGGQKPLHIF